MRTSILMLSAVLAMSVLSLGACAGAPSAQAIRNQMVVEVSDLDPHSEQGAILVLRRITAAAGKLCGGSPTFSSYTGALDSTFSECRDTAVRQAISQLNAPLVARVYRETQPALSRP
jgi:UrcA family protein